MSQLVQHSIAIPPGATARQVMSIGSDGKTGPLNFRVSMMAALDFSGNPQAVDSAIITFEESSDNGANWTALGSSTTVKAEANINVLPSQPLIRVKARTTGGAGAVAKVDIAHTGRFPGGGHLDIKVFGGKDGLTYAGDPSASVANGNASATPPGTWPASPAPFPP